MPTGYTAGIAEGASFTQYALGCARAFGAFHHLRDMPGDSPLTPLTPSTYHQEALVEAQEALEAFKGLTSDEVVNRYHQEYLDQIDRINAALKEKRELRVKYEEMLEKVRSWVPPTEDHGNFKEFMESQLVSSIDWDCGEEYYIQDLEKPRTPFVKWVEDNIKHLTRDVTYHQEEMDKEMKRVEDNNQWAVDLKNSLITGACAAILNPEGTHVLMIERKEAPGKFGLVGGGVEPGECPKNTMIREVEEETGYSLGWFINPQMILSSMDDYNHLTNTYLVKPNRLFPGVDFTGPEGLELAWVSLRDMANPDLTTFPEYNKKVLAAIKGEVNASFDPRF